MLENPAVPSFPHDKLLHGTILPRNTPPPNPLQRKKVPLKTSVHVPITVTICKQWSKFVTCSPSPGNCGGVSRPQRHNY